MLPTPRPHHGNSSGVGRSFSLPTVSSIVPMPLERQRQRTSHESYCWIDSPWTARGPELARLAHVELVDELDQAGRSLVRGNG